MDQYFGGSLLRVVNVRSMGGLRFQRIFSWSLTGWLSGQDVAGGDQRGVREAPPRKLPSLRHRHVLVYDPSVPCDSCNGLPEVGGG